MTTYTCKCGKTFGKNTEAGTTGFRMPDYGPGHECYGCPFVCPVMTWDPTTQKEAVQNHECRASKGIRYDSTAALSLKDKCVGRIDSLDFDFLRRVREYADGLDGIDPDRYAFSSRAADYGTDGRYRLTIYPAQNNKGIAAKQQLFDEFFNPDGTRKDISLEEEKEIVLRQIQDGKREAQHTMAQYQHTNKVYFVKESDDGKFRAYFYYQTNPPTHIPVGDIPPCDAEWIAQKMLDDYAQRRGFEVYDPDSTGEEAIETEQPDEAPENFGPDGMEELAEYAEYQALHPETVNAAHSEPEDSDDAEDDDAEDSPEGCSWQNASGSEEDSKEDEDPDEISGDPLSLRGPEFDAIISTADGVLNRLVSMLHAKKQHDGEMTIKVTFEDLDGSYLFSGAVSGKINYTVKPQKIVGDAMELRFDPQGNPIIPYDREHQLSFDEVPPAAPVVTQVDGSTGLVEKVMVQEDEQPEPELDESNTADQDEDNCPGELYPCSCSDCLFFAAGVGEDSGCCFDSEDSQSSNYPGDVWEAVHMHGCQRQEVLDAYCRNDPDDRDDENFCAENTPSWHENEDFTGFPAQDTENLETV